MESTDRIEAQGSRPFERLNSLLLLTLVLAVCGVGILVARADAHIRAELDELSCLEKVHTTAAVALLAPDSRVDTEGRLQAMRELGDRAARC